VQEVVQHAEDVADHLLARAACRHTTTRRIVLLCELCLLCVCPEPL
jgi:hypothetical protein